MTEEEIKVLRKDAKLVLPDYPKEVIDKAIRYLIDREKSPLAWTQDEDERVQIAFTRLNFGRRMH